MYIFNVSMKNDFLQGRKIIYIANKLEISPNGLRSVLNGKRCCSKVYAYALLKWMGYDVDNDFIKYFRKGK